MLSSRLESGAFDARPNGASRARATCRPGASAIRRGTPKAGVRPDTTPSTLPSLRLLDNRRMRSTNHGRIASGRSCTLHPVGWIIVARVGKLVNVSSVNNSAGGYCSQAISRQGTCVVVGRNHDESEPCLTAAINRVLTGFISGVARDFIIGRHRQSKQGIESISHVAVEILRNDYSASALAPGRVIRKAYEIRRHHGVLGGSTVIRWLACFIQYRPKSVTL